MTCSRKWFNSSYQKFKNLNLSFCVLSLLQINNFYFVYLVAILILIINLAPEYIYLIIYDC